MIGTVPAIATPLPTLDLALAAAAFEWPQPPFARRGVMAPLPEGPQPCRIETPNGSAVEADLLAFEPAPGLARFRVGAGGQPLELLFTRFRRLTLSRPWALARRSPDAPVERVPSAAQERDYRIDLPGGGHLAGRSMGHVQAGEGLYLFAPDDGGDAVRRVFVPAAACAMVTFGKSSEEAAMERWVATPEALLRAIEQQRHSRIMSVGDAVVELGFVTRGVIDQVMRQQGPNRDKPLGEMLIAAGHLHRDDLQTALAHKMGYPVVDLTRFPVDGASVRLLSQAALREHRALPVLRHGERLFVAVDDLARIPRLKALQALAGLEVVPVLAPRGRLALVLASLPQLLGSDLWANNVPADDSVH